jgi:hypothetical protein
MILLKVLGFMLFAYTVISLAQGRICTRGGIRGRMVDKDKEPDAFWSSVALYIALSLALCVNY